MGAGLSESLERAAYRARQSAVLLQCLAGQHVLRKITGQKEVPPAAVQRAVQARYVDLLETDLENVRAGHYPRSLLFQLPLGAYARKFPGLLSDLPRTMRRMHAGAYDDLPSTVDLRRFPPYYRRTFHWQTDGYFSARSAELYDVGVEFLFLGTADIMRRQVIPPLSRFLAAEGERKGRLLDIACGTGRGLRQIALAHPDLDLYGFDLSPYYLKTAARLLEDVPRLSLLQGNAEELPFKDGYFDAISCIYLFHELPRNARRRVANEMFRVLRPGGLLVLEDSCQRSDSPELGPALDRFGRDFHEPFYSDYLEDDLARLLVDTGFELESESVAFVSKVVEARRP